MSILDNTTSMSSANGGNETFDFAYWSQLRVDLSFKECTQELSFVFGDETLMYLQTSDNLQYISRKCGQVRDMRDVFFFIALAVGIPANGLALVAMVTLQPRSIAALYIALLAACDLASLVFRGIDYVIVSNKVDIPQLVCGLKFSAVNFCPCYANWVLVLICFERFYTLRFPLSKAAHFTASRGRLLAALVGLLLFIFYFSRAFMVHVIAPGYCDFIDPDLAYAFLKADEIVFFYGPTCLIFIFVALIAWEIRKAQQSRERMFYTNSLQDSSDNGDRRSKRRSTGTADQSSDSRPSSGMPLTDQTSRLLRQQQRNEWSITIMMVCAAMFFLVLTLPICVMIQLYFEPLTGVKGADWAFQFELAQCMNMMTHVGNFFVYFITCRRMRIHLWHMLHLGKLQRLWCCRACARPSCCADNRRLSVTTPDNEETRVSRLPMASLGDNDSAELQDCIHKQDKREC